MPDNNPDAVKLLSDDEVAEIAVMFPHAECQPTLNADQVDPCEFCKGTIDDHKANCVVPHVHALCATVRALRADPRRVWDEHPNRDGSGKKCTECGFDNRFHAYECFFHHPSLKISEEAFSTLHDERIVAEKANIALREQLAQLSEARDQLRDQLAQVTLERNRLQEQLNSEQALDIIAPRTLTKEVSDAIEELK